MDKALPRHLGIIMDGNRRWARERGLATFEGHRHGYDKLVDFGRWAKKAGITMITAYAFSTENWKRSKREVGYLFRLLKNGLTKELYRFQEEGIRLRVIGKLSELPADLRAAIRHAEAATAHLTEGVLNLAINYGGRLEIVEAVKQLVRKKQPITEATVQGALWTAGDPDPDMIIRTSGEQRLSGFLTWQSVYSELLFVPCHWPAFTKRHFDAALAEYARRKRRFGS